MGPLSTEGGKSVAAAFGKRFPNNDDASGLVYLVGVLAFQDGKDGKPTFPAVRACMPIILRMLYHAATDPDPAARADFLLAAQRLAVFAAARDFKVTKGAPK